jgi:hypothetical protein
MSPALPYIAAMAPGMRRGGGEVFITIRDVRPGHGWADTGEPALIGVTSRDAPLRQGDRLDLGDGTPVIVIRETTTPPSSFGGEWEQTIYVGNVPN